MRAKFQLNSKKEKNTLAKNTKNTITTKGGGITMINHTIMITKTTVITKKEIMTIGTETMTGVTIRDLMNRDKITTENLSIKIDKSQ